MCFRRPSLKEAEAAQPPSAGRPRGLAQAAARHHRSGRRQGSRRRRARRARQRSEESRRLSSSASPSPTSPHYVRPGSALDREALVRGNSVYFPDRVVPMLPERISNDLCSLRPQRGPRRARGAHGHRRRRPQALAQLPSRADPLRREAQLRSRRRRAIDGWPDDTTGPLLGTVLEPLYAAYRALKRARDERAPLDLDLPERKIVLTAHNTVDRVMTPERLDCPPADRGIHDPRQCRGRRDAGARRTCR